MLLSEIKYASIADYSPEGTSSLSSQSRDMRTRVKACKPEALKRIAELFIREKTKIQILAKFVNHNTIVVPVPKSSPIKIDTLWPSLEIAKTLEEHSLIQNIRPYLERIKAVPQSHLALPGERPDFHSHYNSIRCTADPSIFDTDIILIDDVITKGTTFFACAAQIKEKLPNATIKALAIIRTRNIPKGNEVKKILNPSIGRILYNNGNPNRED